MRRLRVRKLAKAEIAAACDWYLQHSSTGARRPERPVNDSRLLAFALGALGVLGKAMTGFRKVCEAHSRRENLLDGVDCVAR